MVGIICQFFQKFGKSSLFDLVNKPALRAKKSLAHMTQSEERAILGIRALQVKRKLNRKMRDSRAISSSLCLT
jgi:hypothetical protein